MDIAAQSEPNREPVSSFVRPPTPTHDFRPDIDGLRAIAVIPVVLFHAGISGFSGGFIGVDVFFVISGFLITGILLRSIHDRTFSIRGFYERRIRRILPALTLVLAVSTAVALLVYDPDTLISYGKSLLSVSLFGSNFYFWKSVGYFAAHADVQPLLHTWSLAVEEQFYIFYPLLLWALVRFRIRIRTIIAVIAAVSLALSIYATTHAPGANFYLLPTRAWELMVGGLLAASPKIELSRMMRQVTALAGLIIICACVYVYDGTMSFPGLTAVPPVLGTALVIFSGHNERNEGSALLRTAPLVAVGRASYSFYLWHFPALAFGAYLAAGTVSPTSGFILSLLSLGAALLTLRFVEDPVRRSRKSSAVVLPLAGMAFMGICGLALAVSSGLPSRLPAASLAAANAPRDKTVHHMECMSVDNAIVPPSKACLLGDKKAAPHVLLWGDSHAMVTATAMEAAALRRRASFLFAAAADCPPGLGFSISPNFVASLTTTPSYRFCGDYNSQMMDRALQPDISTVVLSARWSNWRIDEPPNPTEEDLDIRLSEGGRDAPHGGNHQVFERGFTRLVAELTEAGKKVVIVGPVPEPQFDVPKLLYVQRFGFAPSIKDVSREDYERRHARILAYFRQLSAQYPVTFVEPVDRLCRGTVCPGSDAQGPRYFDHNHLSVRVAKEVSPLFDPIFIRTE